MGWITGRTRNGLALALLAGLVAAAPRAARADVLYLSNDSSPFNVERFTSGGVGSTFASGYLGATGLAFDTSGNLYVANQDTNKITKTTPGGVTTTFATTDTFSPFDLAFDSAGNLYLTGQDLGHHLIEKFTPGGVESVYHDFGLNTAPAGLAFDSAGNLFVATYGSADTIEKFSPTGTDLGAFSTIAGTSAQGHISRSLAFDSAGNLFVSTQLGNTIKKFATNGTSTVFASGGSLQNPYGLAFDSTGNLFVASLTNNEVVEFAPDGSSSVFADSTDGIHGPQFLAFTDDAGTPLRLANQAVPLPSAAWAGFALLGGLGIVQLRRP